MGNEKQWYFINHEGHRSIPEIANFIWRSIIFDESTALKSPTSKISKFFINWFKDVPVKIILAGKPDPETRLDFIQQLCFLGVMPLNYYQFRDKYCYLAGFEFLLTEAGKKFLSKILTRHSSFLRLKDVGIGAKIIYMTHTVELSPEARKQYRLIIENLKISNQKMTIYKTVSFIWARRLFGGFLNGEFIYNFKLLEIKYLLGEMLPKSSPKIILAIFLKEIYILKSELEKFYKLKIITGETPVVERMKIEKEFQEGKLNLLILEAEAVRFSHNFSRASEVIFYSTPLSLLTREQCEARAKLRKSLLIIDLICFDTIEEDFIVSLKNKEKDSQLMERIVRRIQNEHPLH